MVLWLHFSGFAEVLPAELRRQCSPEWVGGVAGMTNENCCGLLAGSGNKAPL